MKLIEIFEENIRLKVGFKGLGFSKRQEIKEAEYLFQANFFHGNEMKRGCKHANVRKKSV